MKQTSSQESGIRLLTAPRMSASAPGKKRSVAYTALLALLGICSSFSVFFSMFSLQVDYSLFFAGVLLCWAVSSLFCILGNRWPLVLIPALLGGELLLVKYWSLAVDGFCYVFNAIYQRVHHTAELYYTGLPGDNQIRSTTALLLFCMLFFSVLICFFTISRPNAVICFVLTGALPEIGLYYGVAPAYPAFACLLAYWVGILAQDRVFSAMHMRGRRMHQYHAKEPLRRQVGVQSALTGAFLILILFSAVTAGLKWSHFSRSQKLDDLRMQIKSGLRSITLPKELEVDTPVPSPFKFSQVTSSPDTFLLGQQAEIRFTYEPMLHLNYSMVPKYDLYLKSYVGSRYDNNSWGPLPDRQYQILENGIQPTGTDYSQTLLYRSLESWAAVSSYDSYGKLRTGNMEFIPAQLESDLAFIPYPLSADYDTSLLMPYHDGSFKRLEPQSYRLPVLLDDYINFSVMYMAGANLDADQEQQDQWEADYRKFVYDSYLTVPDTEAMRRVREAYSSQLENSIDTSSSYADRADMVLREVADLYNAITETCTYTLRPGAVPEGRELVEYFLLESRKGYCSYFATAGVMLCRMAGIPARYVEGVAVPRGELAQGTAVEMGGTTLKYQRTVDDSHAHAWAEIYLDGIGWIPYDFTPGGVGSNQQAARAETATTTATAPQTTTQTTTTGPEHAQSSTAAGSTAVSAGTQVTAPASGTSPRLKTGLLILAGLGAVLLLLWGIWKLLNRRAKRIWEKRTAAFASEDTNAAVIAAYQYMLKLLTQMGLTPGNETPADFAARAEEACPYLTEDALTRGAAIAEYADLSQHTVPEADRRFLAELAMQLQKAYASDCTRFQRFRLRFFRCLIQ